MNRTIENRKLEYYKKKLAEVQNLQVKRKRCKDEDERLLQNELKVMMEKTADSQ